MVRLSVFFGIAWLALMTPAFALEPVADQFGHDDLINLTTPGTVWCFQPRQNTCSYIQVWTEPEKRNPRFDLIEWWDTATQLTTHTSIILRGDGTLCSKGYPQIDTAEAEDLDGNPVSDARLAEIKRAMHADKADYEDVEYCYAYTPADTNSFGLYVEIMFYDGVRNDGKATFLRDPSSDALQRYTIRPLE